MAIDLGVSSGRVMVGHGTEQGFTLRESTGSRTGLAGGRRAALGSVRCSPRLDGLPSVGEEAVLNQCPWTAAVDYGLLDDDGDLIADPASYRDTRTGPPFAAVTHAWRVAGIDAPRLYEATGIAVHPINTVFQLMAERESTQFAPAGMLCWCPT